MPTKSRSITTSRTMQGLLAAATPIIADCFAFSALAPEGKAILITGAVGWLWALYGVLRRSDVHVLKQREVLQ